VDVVDLKRTVSTPSTVSISADTPNTSANYQKRLHPGGSVVPAFPGVAVVNKQTLSSSTNEQSSGLQRDTWKDLHRY
jgi:hypothetical protein